MCNIPRKEGMVPQLNIMQGRRLLLKQEGFQGTCSFLNDYKETYIFRDAEFPLEKLSGAL